MGFGLKVFTWLALLATSQGAPADVSFMNEKEFQIPITLPADPAFQSEIEQLCLFVSTDEGKTWRQEAVASPRDKHFPFVAKNDGTYWFNVSIVDKQKRQYPPDVSAVPPALKVIVDTRKPIVKLTSAERTGDMVTVAWDVKDEHLDLTSFQLEYRTSESPTWYVVPVTPPAATGQKRWPLAAAGKVTVRLQAQDAAGNLGATTTEIAPEPTNNAVASNVVSTPPAPMPPTGAPAPSVPAMPSAKPEETKTSGWQRASDTPALAKNEAANKADKGMASSPAPSPSGITNAVVPAEESGPRVIARVSNPPAMPTVTSNSSPVASNAVPPTMPLSNPPAVKATKPSMPALQFSNSLHVELNYKISTIGPSGVEKVELWLTQDDGRTWRRFAEDTDKEPPFDVDLPGEGVYGFSIVVISKAGMGRKAPQPGEPPALRLEVDTTLPEAELYAVEADPRRKDALYLRWNATDRNLMTNPITLQWSEKEGGPWNDIARDVANTGRHEWQMPANLPYRVYLRLEVKDQAGNTAVAETREPVLVDLTEPEAELTGISTGKKK